MIIIESKKKHKSLDTNAYQETKKKLAKTQNAGCSFQILKPKKLFKITS